MNWRVFTNKQRQALGGLILTIHQEMQVTALSIAVQEGSRNLIVSNNKNFWIVEPSGFIMQRR